MIVCVIVVFILGILIDFVFYDCCLENLIYLGEYFNINVCVNELEKNILWKVYYYIELISLELMWLSW